MRSVGGFVDQELPALGLVRIAVRADGTDGYADGQTIADAIAGQPGVLSAEFDARVRVEFTPNDQYYATDPFTGLGQWGIRTAKVDQAWDTVRAAMLTVAVIDTGVDPGHPDLQGALLPGRSFLSAPSATCTSTTADDNSHGTHVSGIIAANGNNAVGISGVAFGVKILPLKALDCEGIGIMSDVAQAIIYAADQGVRIISISLGSPSDSPTLRSALQYAASRNSLVVVAAGNCGVSTLSPSCGSLDQASYPAAYPEALAVAATDTTDTRASFSTQGSYVDIAAPGRAIVSTVPTYPSKASTRSYAAFNGTSQAAPFVAGVAALIWSREPALTATQVRERLLATADDLGAPGRDDAFGAGRVNALRAVSSPVTAPPPVTAPAPTPAPTPSGPKYGAVYLPVLGTNAATLGVPATLEVRLTNSGTLTWPAAGPAPVRLAYHWIDAAGRVVIWDGQRTLLPRDILAGESVSVPLAYTPPAVSGTYTLRIDLVHEGIGWFSGLGVPAHNVTFAVRSGYAATYTVGVPPTVLQGGRLLVPVTVRNDGTVTWRATGANPIRLAAHTADIAGNTVLWDGVRTIFVADVAPGASVTTTVIVAAPLQQGSYRVRVDLVQEGVAWLSGLGVPTGDTFITVIGDFRATLPTGPLTVSRAAAVATISVTNTSSATWTSGGAASVTLSSHWLDSAGRVLVWDGPRAPLPKAVAPGETIVISVPLGPVPAGAAQLVIDVVADGLRWFGAGAARPVTLAP